MDEHSEDSLLGGRVALRQSRQGYRAAVDPVLLAATLPLRPGARLLDLGCGSGAVGLCARARLAGLDLWGLEAAADMRALADDNYAANGADPAQVVAAMLPDWPAALARQSFDLAVANPPYLDPVRHRLPPEAQRAAAHGLAAGTTLADWSQAAARALRPGGLFATIQRADRLPEILDTLGRGWGAVTVLPIQPRAAAAAVRVVVQARRGRKTPFLLLPPLVLHGEDGQFTSQAQAILRDAAPLPMEPPFAHEPAAR